jgi:hypothetical protein
MRVIVVVALLAVAACQQSSPGYQKTLPPGAPGFPEQLAPYPQNPYGSSAPYKYQNPAYVPGYIGAPPPEVQPSR